MMNIKLPCPIGSTLIDEDGNKYFVNEYVIKSQSAHLLFADCFDGNDNCLLLVGRDGELVGNYTVEE